MSFCNCNQGRLPCECKTDPVGEVIAEDAARRNLPTVSELNRPTRLDHYAAMASDAEDIKRIIAERDALQLLLNERDERIDALTPDAERWRFNRALGTDTSLQDSAEPLLPEPDDYLPDAEGVDRLVDDCIKALTAAGLWPIKDPVSDRGHCKACAMEYSAANHLSCPICERTTEAGDLWPQAVKS